MSININKLLETNIDELYSKSESHFNDFKSAQISPAKLSKTVSAFANASGGDIYVGIDEVEGPDGKEFQWQGFANQEAANPIFQILEKLGSLHNNYSAEFLASDNEPGLVLHLTILKTQEIISATDGTVYVRRNAQNLPLRDEHALERLRYEKGIKSFEDELLDEALPEITNSNAIYEFLLSSLPAINPEDWVLRQRLARDGRPTVAGILLYSDNPQAILPKRSAVKILRYKTADDAERDFLAFDPITIEGPIYDVIYGAVDRIKDEIEKIEKRGPKGMETVSYPQEALHELLTNAVLHRDYSIAADVQVRIFDNRIEIESPGRLPGHVTLSNIKNIQFSRNPKIVRLVNKYENPPNKDVGEGVNTAIEAMGKLRLKPPVFSETETAVLVILKHESLASPEQMIMEFLKTESEITNAQARELTGVKSENKIKRAFYALRDMGQIELIQDSGKRPAWRKLPSENVG